MIRYRCPDCDHEADPNAAIYSHPVWHCPACDCHWLDGDEACRNCHRRRYARPRTAKPFDDRA